MLLLIRIELHHLFIAFVSFLFPDFGFPSAGSADALKLFFVPLIIYYFINIGLLI